MEIRPSEQPLLLGWDSLSCGLLSTFSSLSRKALAALLAACLAAGCAKKPPPPAAPAASSIEPLAVQQLKAYPEAVTGRFVPLADFEDSPSRNGHQQVRQFSITGAGTGGQPRFAVNVTRTGAGALEVVLPPGEELIFRGEEIHDFSPYTLLSFAVHSQALRDDLTVSLESPLGVWRCPPMLLQQGWSTECIDLAALRQAPRFDISRVTAIRIGFSRADREVSFFLDDLMLLDNQRVIAPSPPGVTLEKTGLEYSLQIPLWPGILTLKQMPDGLWRFDQREVAVQITSAAEAPRAEEDLELMGNRRIGQVEILEASAARLRLANTWYFPSQLADWVSLGVRKIRCESTFYPDGRWVRMVEVDNAGGPEIGLLRLASSGLAAWSGEGIKDHIERKALFDPISRYRLLQAPPGTTQRRLLEEYISPGRLEIALGEPAAYATGDADRDRFDESQGCYYVQAKAGHCRFKVFPPPIGMTRPVFRIAGPWTGKVEAGTEGLAIRDIAILADGSAILTLPATLDRATSIEVTGSMR